MNLRAPALLLLLLVLFGPASALATPPVSEGFLLEAIRIEPPDEAVERAVRAHLRLPLERPVALGELLSAERTLELSGYFRRVDVYTERGTAPGRVVLVVSGELDRSAHLESGFSHEPAAGWVLDVVGVRWNSPFRRGGYLRTGLRVGFRASELHAEWMRPRLFGRGMDFLVQADAGSHLWLAVDGEDLYRQDIGRGQLRTGLRFQVGRATTATLWLGRSGADPENRLAGVDIEDEPAGRLVPVPGDPQRFSDLALDVRWVGDRPDEVWRHSTSLGASVRGSQPDEGDAFAISHLQLGWARPWGARNALAWQLTGAWSSPGTPYHLRPVFGGTGSVRGYRDASLSGPLGARARWRAGVEFRRRLLTAGDGRARVVGQVFADAGQAWSVTGEPADPVASAGYGVRIRVPWIQVFGIDVGVPLSPTVTRDAFWVHATLGFRF